MSDLGTWDELKIASRVYTAALKRYDDRNGGPAHYFAGLTLQGELEAAEERLRRAAAAFAENVLQRPRASNPCNDCGDTGERTISVVSSKAWCACPKGRELRRATGQHRPSW